VSTKETLQEDKQEVKEEVKKEELTTEPTTEPKENTDATNLEETPEQINWRKFREERKKERQESERLEKESKSKDQENLRMKEMMATLLKAKDQTPMTVAETDKAVASLDPTDIPTGADVQNYVNSHVEALVEERINKMLASQEAQRKQETAIRDQKELPQRLQKDCPDFENVCSSENLDYLEYHYPEVAEAYQSMPDGIKKWKGVYGTIKKLIPNTNSSKDSAREKANSMKPQSMSSPGVSTTGDSAPNYVSSTKREENWKRMQRVMRGGS